MTKKKAILAGVLLWAALTWMPITSALATELQIPPMTAVSGQPVDVPIMIDEVENLAGIKIVMRYDAKILVFKKGVKTKHSSSLMHIINDKTPGTLIVVMAGARGIKGKSFPILHLHFETTGGLKEKRVTTIEISDVEMMSDKLKEVTCQVKVNPLVISTAPAKGAANEAGAKQATTPGK